MRILLVSDHYPPAIGGAERQTYLLAQVFAEQGYEITVAVPWYKGSERVHRDGRVTVVRVRQLRTALTWLVRDQRLRHAPPFPDPITIRDLRGLIQRFRPDVVHSHGWITYSCAVALTWKKTPLLVSARDYGYFCANRTLVRDGAPCSGPELAKCLGCAGRYYGIPKGWIAVLGVLAWRPLLRRKLVGLHSISTYVSAVMREHFLDARANRAVAQKRHVLQFVIPSFRLESSAVPSDAPLTAYLQALPAEPFILFVGEFRRVKGVEILLAAYAKLDRPPPLVLIGTYARDGPAEFPSDVTALTGYPHEAVMAAWDQALFGVMPSLWPEPFGSVVHEAMSRGKPVIGTNHGGHTDMIIDGETGALVPPGNVDALARAMEDLLRDPERRERLGRSALERATLFAADAVVPQFERAYNAVSRNNAPDENSD
jgi:glycosyltransferase involved in cell wall biosynthesis